MSKKTRPSLARLRELERRQGIRRWNRYYQTAIRASKTEAPSSSWCTLVYAPRFGRMLHALSLPEANVFHVAVYHPLVVEALDQYVIPTTPAPHFLDESPFTDGRRNKPYRGSVAVAQELGFLNLHPVVRLQDELIPFPYIGDLLLFLNTYQGVKPINWSIKASAADFEQPFDNMHETLTSDRRLRHVRARHAIEEQVHKDVGVPTVHVAASDVPPVLARNLAWCNLHRQQAPVLSASKRNKLLDILKDSVAHGLPLNEACRAISSRCGITQQEAKAHTASAIFDRSLPLEIETTILLLDRPVSFEKHNPLDLFKHWFEEAS